MALLNARPDLAGALSLKPWLGSVVLDSAAYDVATIMRQRHLRLHDRASRSLAREPASR